MKFKDPRSQRLFYDVYFPLAVSGMSIAEIDAFVKQFSESEYIDMVFDYMSGAQVLSVERAIEDAEKFGFDEAVLVPMSAMFFWPGDIALVKATTKGRLYKALIADLEECFKRLVIE